MSRTIAVACKAPQMIQPPQRCNLCMLSLQTCTQYDPAEVGRARVEALLRRLQEMGFGLEAARGALRTATHEGLTDQRALERAAELLTRAG